VSIERKAVRNDVAEPNLALLYPCEEFVDVFLRGRMTESQRDSLVEDLAERKGCGWSHPWLSAPGYWPQTGGGHQSSMALKICHYYRLPGNAVDTSGVLIFCLVPPQKVAEITPFGTTVCNL
jgi:hypothetical protein